MKQNKNNIELFQYGIQSQTDTLSEFPLSDMTASLNTLYKKDHKNSIRAIRTVSTTLTRSTDYIQQLIDQYLSIGSNYDIADIAASAEYSYLSDALHQLDNTVSELLLNAATIDTVRDRIVNDLQESTASGVLKDRLDVLTDSYAAIADTFEDIKVWLDGIYAEATSETLGVVDQLELSVNNVIAGLVQSKEDLDSTLESLAEYSGFLGGSTSTLTSNTNEILIYTADTVMVCSDDSDEAISLFLSSGTQVYVNPEVIPNKVFDSSNIQTSAVTGSKLSSSAITLPKLDSTLMSGNYTTTSGWKLDKAGSLQLNEVTASGDVVVTDIVDNTIDSGNFSHPISIQHNSSFTVTPLSSKTITVTHSDTLSANIIHVIRVAGKNLTEVPVGTSKGIIRIAATAGGVQKLNKMVRGGAWSRYDGTTPPVVVAQGTHYNDFYVIKPNHNVVEYKFEMLSADLSTDADTLHVTIQSIGI